MRLKGKVALVTGASRGIGRAVDGVLPVHGRIDMLVNSAACLCPKQRP